MNRWREWIPYKHRAASEHLPRMLSRAERLWDSWEASRQDKVENLYSVHDAEAAVIHGLAGKFPNLISSQLDYRDQGRYHAPVIDLDIPCRLLPSSTPDHWHLYIDQAVEWKSYAKLLEALLDCGFIQHGYYEAAMKYKQTYVRWNTTKQEEAGSA